MSITVYGYPNTRSLRATWMCEELALDYQYQLVNLVLGEAHQQPFLKVSAGGKVPALVTDAGSITESLAIVNYLGSVTPESNIIPTASPFRRAIYDQWTIFAIAELEQPLWTMGKHKFVLPKEKRVPAVVETAQWEFQTALKLFSEGLGDNDFILGNDFTAADILLGHCLFWGLAFKQSIEQENLKAYLGRVGARPALVAARKRESSALPSE